MILFELLYFDMAFFTGENANLFKLFNKTKIIIITHKENYN